MKTFKIHPLAEIYPMESEEKIKRLAESIAKIGQLDPGVLHPDDDRLVDGRCRQAACKLAGVEFETVYWDAEGSLVEWVIAKNGHRRHLSQDQQIEAALKALPFLEAEAKERMKKGVAPDGASKTGKSTEIAAKQFGVSARQLERAKSVVTNSPDLVEKVRAGKMTWNQAAKVGKRAEQVELARQYVPPKDLYPVIACDPPWQYDDALDGSDRARGGTPYPTMTEAEICALKVPADDDCVLWLWVTNAHLIDGTAARVLEAWGFTPKTLLTWLKSTKDGDGLKLGSGHWLRGATEHVVLATKGKPTWDLKNQATAFVAPVGPHSAKPDRFYELAEQLCPTRPRLEMFARRHREGWVTSGSELPAPTNDLAELLVIQQGDRYFLTAAGARVVAEHENGAELPHGTEVDPATGVAKWLFEAAEKGAGQLPKSLTLGGFGPADLKEHAERRRLYVVSDNQPEAPTFFWTCDGNRNDGKDYATADEAKAAAEKNEALVRKLVAGGTERRKNEIEPAPPVKPKRKPKMRIEDTDKEINT
jgi:N6-adenosine-specific RNA methylase IME4